MNSKQRRQFIRLKMRAFPVDCPVRDLWTGRQGRVLHQFGGRSDAAPMIKVKFLQGPQTCHVLGLVRLDNGLMLRRVK